MLNLFFSLTIFLFGLIVGSFLNSIIYRFQTGESFLLKRSYCPHCKHILSWLDLIPVLSFIFLGRKCRYCKEKISWQYPIVEIATGLLFLSIFNFQLPSVSGGEEEIHLCAFNFIIVPFLIVIFVYDLKHYIIPDKIIYPAIIIAGIFNFQSLSILSAVGSAAFFLAMVLVSRGRWMGIGDIKLAFLMGLVLGWPNILVALFSAFFIGAIIGLGLIISGKKKLKSEVPFGPFLVAGTFLAMFFGEQLINWYLHLFLIQ